LQRLQQGPYLLFRDEERPSISPEERDLVPLEQSSDTAFPIATGVSEIFGNLSKCV
jgi:hypothetical protein